ncbi:glycerate kinase [Aphanothece hegewaldii CCALA 016]|uniref:Glycerate kinase n=1 Tax=Aphanothece hegewaldii CCALA 016 TaxID=2107694 RepID=A0A2T1M1H1_9CHRO|nr:glycerate kinase [Aphanothece hegewaldii CCALA 016]
MRQLLRLEFTSKRAEAFNITIFNGEREIRQRAKLFSYSCEQVISICQELGFQSEDEILETLWILWIPLACQLAQNKNNLQRPFIQGILGGQGTGKTTLSQIVCLLLSYLGYQAIGISIDDFYKTYAERQKLKAKDPRLVRRGPPGTHDINLALKTFNHIKEASPKELIPIPRFNKSYHHGEGDRIASPEFVYNVDIVLFEGWFVGVTPVEKEIFNQSLSPEIAEVITLKHIQFARDSRRRLKDYLPLWKNLDSLIVLSPQDYRWSITWRTEAEHKMIASGKTGMSDHDLKEFVYYFWRSLHPELYIKPLIRDPKFVDLVIEIDQNHRPFSIQKP